MKDINRQVLLPSLGVTAFWGAGFLCNLRPPQSGPWSALGDWSYVQATGPMHFLQGLFNDIAVAILIAIVVFQFVERSHRAQAAKDRAEVEKRLENSRAEAQARIDRERDEAQNRSFVTMFRRAFGSFFSDEMIQESIDAVFSKTLLRRRFEIEYNFERHPMSRRILRLHIIVEFEIENVSEISQEYDINLMVPNIMASYRNDPLREPPVLLSAGIDDRDLTDAQIEQANSAINIDEHNSILHLGKARISPHKTLKVRTETRVLKSACGAENMKFYLPTKNVKVRVASKEKDLVIDIMGVGGQPFPEKRFSVKDQTRWCWDTSHLFLPENGWVLYWNDVSENLSGLPSVSAESALAVVRVDGAPVHQG
jgi:hypothetical protein